MPGVDDYERVEVSSRAQWRSWLEARHESSPGIWLVTFKKAAGDRYLPYEQAVEEALCFGWVDSRIRSLDELRTQTLMTPRKAGSEWARSNKERVERLEAAGLMTPAGRAAVKRGILCWIASAKREETRARRIAKAADRAAEGKPAVG